MKRRTLISTLLSVAFIVLISSVAYAFESTDLVGKWKTEKKKAVFVELDLKADGTGHFVNYAGKASDGKWSLDKTYLRFESGGEKSGGMAKLEGDMLKVSWVADYKRVK